MFLSRLLHLTVLSIIFLSLSTQAALTKTQQEAAAKLLNSPTRPLARDILNAFPEWPTENPFQAYASYNYATYDYSMLAENIVRFEQAYPDAVYVGMGRDMVPLVDALDIYYMSIGQEKRALRLDASGATIRSEQPEKLAKFMIAQGIDLSGKSKKKYVLFDATGYATSSQMYQLIFAGYQHAQAQGIKPVDFVKTLAGLSVYGGDTVNTDTKSKELVALAKSEAEARGVQTTVPFVSYSYSHNKLTYLLEWHDSFGKLYENAQGVMVADPGNANDINTRGAILQSLFQMIEFVKSDGFANQLKALHEQGFKYEHKPKRVSCRKAAGL